MAAWRRRIMASARRRQQVRELYGFDFPDDLFQFWDLASRCRPLEPLRAFDALGIELVGPFEVLAGRFDGRATKYSQLLHWRYYTDPPEFFTVLVGFEGGPHWGVYLDEPGEPGGCIASYYAGETLELSMDGDTLVEAVRMRLEQCVGDWEFAVETGEGAIEPGELARQIDAAAELRQRLMQLGTGSRPETGHEYEERYEPFVERMRRVIAPTLDGMGIVAPGDTYRPLKRKSLNNYLRRTRDPKAVVAEARQALADGYPATALKVGKDLWTLEGKRRQVYAFELLDAAYAALRRPILQNILRVHHAHRQLPSVDILENEGME
jgi:hypothetical protein